MACKARQLKLSNGAKSTGGTDDPCHGMFLKRKVNNQFHFGRASARPVLMSPNGANDRRQQAAGGEVQNWLTGSRAKQGPDGGGMKRNISPMIRDTQKMPRFLCTITAVSPDAVQIQGQLSRGESGHTGRVSLYGLEGRLHENSCRTTQRQARNSSSVGRRQLNQAPCIIPSLTSLYFRHSMSTHPRGPVPAEP